MQVQSAYLHYRSLFKKRQELFKGNHMVEEKKTSMSDIITSIKEVFSERESEHGESEECFGTIASLWSIYLKKEVTKKDVAILMSLLKVARIINKKGDEKKIFDSELDFIGYALFSRFFC